LTQMVSELYEALRAAGVKDETARAAAQSVIAIEDKEHLATKADLTQLRADFSEMKGEIIKWNVVTMGVMTALFSAIVTLLKFKP